MLVLLGVGNEDNQASADYLSDKIVGLRIFEDDNGKMNKSVTEVGGGVLVVSQFTLYGDVRRGKRPSFDDAAPPENARALYRIFCRAHPRCRTSLRNREVSGDDASRTGQRRAL